LPAISFIGGLQSTGTTAGLAVTSNNTGSQASGGAKDVEALPPMDHEQLRDPHCLTGGQYQNREDENGCGDRGQIEEVSQRHRRTPGQLNTRPEERLIDNLRMSNRGLVVGGGLCGGSLKLTMIDEHHYHHCKSGAATPCTSTCSPR
jgi:hypothetical protein